MGNGNFVQRSKSGPGPKTQQKFKKKKGRGLLSWDVYALLKVGGKSLLGRKRVKRDVADKTGGYKPKEEIGKKLFPKRPTR